jgi:hypothetical protein
LDGKTIFGREQNVGCLVPIAEKARGRRETVWTQKN